MSTFIIRVELHSGTSLDYSLLHTFMARNGFGRTITSDDGVVYHLPPAEYSVVTTTTPENVIASAKHAAQQTGRKFAVLVTEAKAIIWNGLEQVPPQPSALSLFAQLAMNKK